MEHLPATCQLSTPDRPGALGQNLGQHGKKIEKAEFLPTGSLRSLELKSSKSPKIPLVLSFESQNTKWLPSGMA